MIKKGVRHMINYTRIKWTYHNFGLWCAVKSAAIDLIALLAYMGYCLTLPFQFFWLLYGGSWMGKLLVNIGHKKSL